MTDDFSNRQAETLSALMDGEVSEFELRRVLKDMDNDPTMAQKWERYHLASAVLQRKHTGFTGQLDLSARVASAIAEEPVAVSADNKERSNGFAKSVASMAVAASVSALAILAWQQTQTPAPGVAPATAVATAPVPASNYAPAANQVSSLARFQPMINPLRPAAHGTVATNSVSTGEPVEVIRLDLDTQRRLQEYYQSHLSGAAVNTAAGFVPYVQSVPASLESPTPASLGR